MPHEFESGLFNRKPAWHRLGKVVEEWPGSWEAARKLAGLTWEVKAVPVWIGGEHPVLDQENVALVRDDIPVETTGSLGAGDLIASNRARLAIQPTSYHVITNGQFGEVIEYLVGAVGDDWQYETLIALYGGRQIVAVLRAREPLNIGADPSKTFQYVAFTNRFDGQGGLRGIPTNFRVVCANTQKASERQAKVDGVGFTIKHTANWQERIDRARGVLVAATQDGKAWEQLANRLGGKKLHPAHRDRMLDSLFKTDSGMTDKQVRGVQASRDSVRQILGSPTCAGIEDTALGFVQAVTEWADHVRPARNDETRTSRSLLRAEPIKAKAFALVRNVA